MTENQQKQKVAFTVIIREWKKGKYIIIKQNLHSVADIL